MCRVAQQAVCSLISGADSAVQMDGAALERSCEVAEMEEVQLGTDSFYYVWEDAGNPFYFPTLSVSGGVGF